MNFSLLVVFTGLWTILYSGTLTFTFAIGSYEIFTLSMPSMILYALIVVIFIAILLYKLGETTSLVVSTLTGGFFMAYRILPV